MLIHVEQVYLSEMPPAHAHSADVWWTLEPNPLAAAALGHTAGRACPMPGPG